jgi:hypothetical protein
MTSPRTDSGSASITLRKVRDVAPEIGDAVMREVSRRAPHRATAGRTRGPLEAQRTLKSKPKATR